MSLLTLCSKLLLLWAPRCYRLPCYSSRNFLVTSLPISPFLLFDSLNLSCTYCSLPDSHYPKGDHCIFVTWDPATSFQLISLPPFQDPRLKLALGKIWSLSTALWMGQTDSWCGWWAQSWKIKGLLECHLSLARKDEGEWTARSRKCFWQSYAVLVVFFMRQALNDTYTLNLFLFWILFLFTH